MTFKIQKTCLKESMEGVERSTKLLSLKTISARASARVAKRQHVHLHVQDLQFDQYRKSDSSG